MVAVPSIGRASLVEQPLVAPEASATHGLYERHAAKILGYCHHQLGSREEAEDAVQITFMNAFRALRKGVVPEAEAAWLFKIAENVCLSRRRSSWRRNRIESPADFDVIEEVVPGPNRQRDELIGIEDALASMPEQQRRAILLREWQGLSYREIAEELELSQSAVETLIFRARRSLAQGLTDPAAVKPRRKGLRRALHLADLTTVLATAKSLLMGTAAMKATTAAVAVTAIAGGAATVTPKLVDHNPKPSLRVSATGPSAVAAAPRPTAPVSVSSSAVAPAAVATERGVTSPKVTRAAAERQAAERKARRAAAAKAAALRAQIANANVKPVAPVAPVAATPVASAPEATPAPAPAAPAPPAASAPPAPPVIEAPKHETPKAEPPRHAAQPEPKSKDKESKDPVRTPSAATPPAENANANGKDKDKDKGRKKEQGGQSAPVVAETAVAAVAAAVAAPAEPTQPAQDDDRGNGKDKDKRDEAVPAPAEAAAPAAEQVKDDKGKGRGKSK